MNTLVYQQLQNGWKDPESYKSIPEKHLLNITQQFEYFDV